MRKRSLSGVTATLLHQCSRNDAQKFPEIVQYHIDECVFSSVKHDFLEVMRIQHEMKLRTFYRDLPREPSLVVVLLTSNVNYIHINYYISLHYNYIPKLLLHCIVSIEH